MELDELEVLNDGPGPPGHGNAVTCGDVWVRGFAKYAAQPPGSQQDGGGAKVVKFAGGTFEDYRPHDTAILHQEVHHSGIAGEMHAWAPRGLLVKRTRDLPTCGIAVRMQDTVAAVGPFAGKSKFATLTVELGTPLDEFFDCPGTFVDQRVNGCRIAETIAGIERILLVEGDLIIVTQGGSYPALGIFG